MTRFDELGGEAPLRALVDDFVDRCFDDPMIGFFFARANRERTKRFEYQHAAVFLGAEIEYAGRSIRDAHARHRIMGGQFARRLTILRQTLEDHRVPSSIRDAWLAHQESLRAQVTAFDGGRCD
ncbi:MAG: group 1 truncated hemoglobin [Deltaproteobacteria bacterium]|nr:group 1 truncated hemoglobin [Deltaproteobacteria bacterium]